MEPCSNELKKCIYAIQIMTWEAAMKSSHAEALFRHPPIRDAIGAIANRIAAEVNRNCRRSRQAIQIAQARLVELIQEKECDSIDEVFSLIWGRLIEIMEESLDENKIEIEDETTRAVRRSRPARGARHVQTSLMEEEWFEAKMDEDCEELDQARRLKHATTCLYGNVVKGSDGRAIEFSPLRKED